MRSCSGPTPSMGLIEPPRVLDDAQHRAFPPRIRTDAAEVVLGDVEAPTAEPHPGTHLDDGRRQPLDVDGVGLEDVEGEALRRTGADPR